MKAFKTLAGFCMAAVLCAPACGQGAEKPLELSLSDAIAMARENNNTIKAAKSRIDQADGRIVQSSQAYLPKVTFSETYVRSSDPTNVFFYKLSEGKVTQADFNPPDLNNPDPLSNFNTSLQLVQPIWNADALIGHDIAKKGKSAAQQVSSRTQETIDVQVSRVYYGMLLAQRNIDAVDISIKTMRNYSSEAGRGFKAGIMSESDRLSTEVRVAELVEQRMQLEDAVENATNALRVLLNLEDDVDIVLTSDFVLDGELPDLEDIAVPEDRMDLQALSSMHEIAGMQEDMASAGRIPRFNGFARADMNSSADFQDDNNSWTVGLSMQWSIFSGMDISGRVQEAKARKREIAYQYAEAKKNSVAEIEKAARAMRTATEREAVAIKALREAKVSYDYIGKQYKSGMAMTFELLQREGAYTYAQMRLNQARYDFCVAKSEYAYYTGK